MPFKIPKSLKILLILLSLLLVSLALTNIGKQTSKEPKEQFFFGSKNLHIPKLQREPQVDPLIKNSLSGLAGRYAVYIKDLKTQKSYKYNSDEKFGSASLYKLAVMYKTYDAIDKNQLTKEDILSEDVVALDNTLQGIQNQTETIDQESQGLVSYDVGEALRLMITISDNYSAILLAQRLSWQKIDQLMEEEGFGQIDLINANAPSVTAKAIGDLLERIYSNQAISPNASEEMKSLLFAQKVNDRIPKYLPATAKVGHKTGELDSVRHDAGIVLGKNSHYLFVFLSDTPSPNDAIETIALLSKKIFDELEK